MAFARWVPVVEKDRRAGNLGDTDAFPRDRCGGFADLSAFSPHPAVVRVSRMSYSCAGKPGMLPAFVTARAMAPAVTSAASAPTWVRENSSVSPLDRANAVSPS